DVGWESLKLKYPADVRRRSMKPLQADPQPFNCSILLSSMTSTGSKIERLASDDAVAQPPLHYITLNYRLLPIMNTSFEFCTEF
ncbi:hypothetical protein GWI33_011875, partial [Rhynchophorus ferrugineus]